MTRWLARTTLAALAAAAAYGLSLLDYDTSGRLIAHVSGDRASALEAILWPVGALVLAVLVVWFVDILWDAAR